MDMCGNKAVRNMLVSFNVIFLLLSLALIGIGSWIISDIKAILKYAPEHLSEDKLLIQDVGIAAISIGVISAVISFLGCCGAAKESRKMLFSFLVLMIVIFLSVLVSGIVAISRQELFREVVRKTLEAEANGNETDTGLLKFAHDQYNCCGIEDKPLCDRAYPPKDKCPMGSPLCAQGCLRILWERVFSPYMQVASIILFVLSGIILVGITFAAILFRSVGKADYSYVRQD